MQVIHNHVGRQYFQSYITRSKTKWRRFLDVLEGGLSILEVFYSEDLRVANHHAWQLIVMPVGTCA